MPLSPESVLPGRGILDREDVPVQPKTLEALAAENIRLDRLARSRLRILDSTSEGIYQVDSQGNCIFMNRAACHMLGYDFGEAIGKNMHELHHGKAFNATFLEEQCPIHGHHSRLVTQKPMEDVFRSTDGFSFPVECCSHAVFDRGAQRGSVISFRNIAERKNLERRMLAQHAVSRALEETASTEAVIPLLIRTLGESLGFSVGVLWRLDERAAVLRLAHHWCVPSPAFEQFVEACRQSTFTTGQDLPGKVWEAGEPIWLSDIDPAQASHVRAVKENGFRCGFAMPIRMTKGLFGVLELLAWERMPSDPELFDVLRLVGSAIGQVLERKRSEAVRTRLATILDAGTEFAGVVLDAAGIIISVSRAVEGIFGFEPTELVGKPLETIIPNYRVLLQERLG